MNRQLAEAVIASFHEASPEDHYNRLRAFNRRAWIKAYRWLDASGLALYFLKRLQALHLESSIPPEVLQRLEKNLSDNQDRTTALFSEFVRVNEAFQENNLSYVNLKGFALVPDACPDLTLRRQFDFDFKMDYSDIASCEVCLKNLGYRLTGIHNHVYEFKAGSGPIPSVNNFYKKSNQYSLEVHFSEMPIERRMKHLNNFEFPIFTDCGIFLGLSHHLFKHLLDEWTRTSWILEYASYINFHSKNEKLWTNVYTCLSNNAKDKIAVGAVTLCAQQTFAISYLPPVLACTVKELPRSIHLWIERYREDVVFAQFPGNKLYLLLHRALDEHSYSEVKRQKLLPLHLHKRVTSSMSNERWLRRVITIFSEIHYGLFRLKFHFGGGIRYLIEAQRWSRFLAKRKAH